MEIGPKFEDKQVSTKCIFDRKMEIHKLDIRPLLSDCLCSQVKPCVCQARFRHHLPNLAMLLNAESNLITAL
jgi:hypothetical protein